MTQAAPPRRAKGQPLLQPRSRMSTMLASDLADSPVAAAVAAQPPPTITNTPAPPTQTTTRPHPHQPVTMSRLPPPAPLRAPIAPPAPPTRQPLAASGAAAAADDLPDLSPEAPPLPSPYKPKPPKSRFTAPPVPLAQDEADRLAEEDQAELKEDWDAGATHVHHVRERPAAAATRTKRPPEKRPARSGVSLLAMDSGLGVSKLAPHEQFELDTSVIIGKRPPPSQLPPPQINTLQSVTGHAFVSVAAPGRHMESTAASMLADVAAATSTTQLMRARQQFQQQSQQQSRWSLPVTQQLTHEPSFAPSQPSSFAPPSQALRTPFTVNQSYGRSSAYPRQFAPQPQAPRYQQPFPPQLQQPQRAPSYQDAYAPQFSQQPLSSHQHHPAVNHAQFQPSMAQHHASSAATPTVVNNVFCGGGYPSHPSQPQPHQWEQQQQQEYGGYELDPAAARPSHPTFPLSWAPPQQHPSASAYTGPSQMADWPASQQQFAPQQQQPSYGSNPYASAASAPQPPCFHGHGAHRPLHQPHPSYAPVQHQPQPQPEVQREKDPTLYRPDARLHGKPTLESFFGVTSSTRVHSSTNKRQRKSSKKKTKPTPSKEASFSSARARPHAEDVAESDDEMEDEEAHASCLDTNSQFAAAFGGSQNPESAKQFAQQFSNPHAHGFGGRAMNYLRTRHEVRDLSELDDGSTLADLRACIADAHVYTMAVLNHNLSTNLREVTKEQKKFCRERLGAAKRKAAATEEGDTETWNGGIERPSLLIIEFLKRIETKNEFDSSATPAQPDLTPLLERDMYTVGAINPHPYQPKDAPTPNLERMGVFMLPLYQSAKLMPSAQSKELEHVNLNWQLRMTFLALLQSPPPLLQAVVFDAKALLCALLIHFHVSALDVDKLPQLSDVLIAAWMCDPDDHHNTGFNIANLIAAHVRLPKAALEARITVGPPGDRDLDVMMQDVRDSLLLYDRLANLMHHQRLIEAYVRQEMSLVPVVIDMQLIGIAVDIGLFTQATTKVEEKLAELCEDAHNAAGRSFMLTSSLQVSNVLYDQLKVASPRLTDKGRSQPKQKQHPTTNDSALRQIIASYPAEGKAHRVAKTVLAHRGLFKVLRGYLIPYGGCAKSDVHLLLASQTDRLRICPRWNQCATGTGRLSTRGPNVQALPRATGSKSAIDEGAEDEEEADGDEQPALAVNDSPVIRMQNKKDARPINLPSDVNMRASIVPTPANVARRLVHDRLGVWDVQQGTVVFPPDDALMQAMPNEERCILSADFSQMEVRILALLCQDVNLTRVFNPSYEPEVDLLPHGPSAAASSSSSSSAPAQLDDPNDDVYRRMASTMFQKSLESVTESERKISKQIVLGVIYGMGAESLAGRLSKFAHRSVTTKEAQGYIMQLHQQFPAIKTFVAQTKSDAAQNGHVVTLVGRRRYLPDLRHARAANRAYAERQSVNTVIQGSAADMIKMAMISLRTAIRADPDMRDTVWITMQLHDEIVLELPRRLVQRVAHLMRSIMEHVIPTASLPFTIKVEVGSGLGNLEPCVEE